MRSITIVATVVAALGAFVLVRLGDTLAQLRAIDLPPRVRPAVSPEVAMGERQQRSVAAQSQPATAERATTAGSEPPDDVAAEAPAADPHITRWLLADPEFARAAEELLQDPDVQVQNDARQFLGELGASGAEPPAEP